MCVIIMRQRQRATRQTEAHVALELPSAVAVVVWRSSLIRGPVEKCMHYGEHNATFESRCVQLDVRPSRTCEWKSAAG